MAPRLVTWSSLAALALLATTSCGTGSEPEAQATEHSAGTAAGGSSSPPQGGESSSAVGGKSQVDGNASAGASEAPGDAGAGSDSSGAPPAVDGKSVYVLECRGDSKDCDSASVPCLGVGGGPDAAIGYACSNRCTSIADCSAAPTGAEAQVGCVPFTSASHCVLVCKREASEAACPTGMSCYVYPGSPVGYCLWQ